ncbi:hypothetical protein BB559_002261 [Furculomyces boomerangus]|uniref:Histidine biosynthesis trifunctional protein n=1 Tax=Furculomyces boomerangus TaxID=61424 RepID=A0A2T9YWQ3_9FUNG|nr:hypothetical protein BB559_004256 [Furculomyces boomerangus]PVU96759.1 hypothetical protein BB559_002261 [Furculomyces boomerangus]
MLIPTISTFETSQQNKSAIHTLPIVLYAQPPANSNTIFSSGTWIKFDSPIDLDSLNTFLNNGLDIAILDSSFALHLINDPASEKFPSNRLGLQINNLQSFLTLSNNPKNLERFSLIYISEYSGSPITPDISSAISAFKKTLIAQGGQKMFVINIQNSPSIDIITQLSQNDISVSLPESYLSVSEETSNGSQNKIDLAEAFVKATNLSSDREDGLFTTVVQNETGICLGVAYSSLESIKESLKLSQGVYWSRKRGLWHKGKTSGATQELVGINVDCDSDLLQFVVKQKAPGFCHNETYTCFDKINTSGMGSISKLAELLQSRLQNAPEGSYTKRLFNDKELLDDKIIEEAQELSEAMTPVDVAWEAADLIYFALVKCVGSGVSLADVERNLSLKSKKIDRRPGNSKKKNLENSTIPNKNESIAEVNNSTKNQTLLRTSILNVTSPAGPNEQIKMRKFVFNDINSVEKAELLQRPIIDSGDIQNRVKPIINSVRTRGDVAVKEFTATFDKVNLDKVVITAPFNVPNLPEKVKNAIDTAYQNVYKFHHAQLSEPINIETMPGIMCSRFSRPIERVGLYVPGGTAVLPSSALMLGVPAQVAGCKEIVLATPPTKDGTVVPEVLYVAHLVGATTIVMAGGAQAIAAMAYGTETVPKVDKICGPGNQFVTAAKMVVQNDTAAMVSIDMPAGPSELLVIADNSCEPKYVASDLLSQAEHGGDSQVVLLTVGMNDDLVSQIEMEVDQQAKRLPRVEIVRHSIPKSYILKVDTLDEALDFSNKYAPEHLILQVENAPSCLSKVENAGSVFVGKYSPESCGDYASGTNHTLPTYGFARMYSGVNTTTFQKHITSQTLTKEGLERLGSTVMTLAEVEGLEAHRNAVAIRLA